MCSKPNPQSLAVANRTGMRECLVYQRGLIPYQDALAWQQSLVMERKVNPNLDDVLILLEHPPVYTLKQNTNPEFVKFDRTNPAYEVHLIERGGEVTYHCPGQLVGYPILNLNYYRKDLHWYLRQLEEVLIRVLATYNLPATRIDGLTGVWVDGKKVAAIGIKVSRWISMHGFALNVCSDLSGFARIVPCGITDKPVGSLAEFISEITIEQVRPQVIRAFAEVFEIKVIEVV